MYTGEKYYNLRVESQVAKWICYAFKFVTSMNMLRHVYFKFS